MRVPLAVNTYGKQEAEQVMDVLHHGKLTCGERVLQFEKDVAAFCDSPHAVMVNSGGSANLLALAVLTQPSGWLRNTPVIFPDNERNLPEVIIPAVTWSTGFWPVIQNRMAPVLADVDPQTLNVTVKTVERVMTENTKVVFLAHLLGRPAPIREIQRLCDERGVILIEDACESFGAEDEGKRVGSFGRMGTLSFYFSHHISTIEGGMVLCQREDDAQRIRSMRAHGWLRGLNPGTRAEVFNPQAGLDPRFLFVESGYSMKPTEIQGTLGIVQLSRWHELIAPRLEAGAVWDHYVRMAHPDVFIQMETDYGNSRFAFPLVLRPNAPISRGLLMVRLQERGIDTRPILAGALWKHPGIARQVFEVPYREGAQLVHDNGLYIGLHSHLTDDDMAYVVDVFNQILSA